MKRILLLSAVLFALAQSAANALPVDIPSGLRNPAGPEATPSYRYDLDRSNWGIYPTGGQFGISAQGNYVDERELKGPAGANARAQFYAVKLNVPVNFLGLWDWYGEFGTVVNGRIQSVLNGSSVKYHLEDGKTLMAGGGATWMPLQIPELAYLSVFTDVKYRGIFNASYQSVEIDGVEFKDGFDSDRAKWNEWQAALGVGFRLFDALVPYAGIVYSDVRIDTDVTLGGVNYDIDRAKSDRKMGGVAGLSYIVSKNVSLDAQVRFGDETAYSGQITLKF